MNITLYGIPNCDKIKTAKTWLTDRQLTFTFHDVRKDGLNDDLLEQIIQCLGLEKVINKRSTTYRNLTEEEKQQLQQVTTACNILINYPTLLKRPLIKCDNLFYLSTDIPLLT
jgi:Spx/MgsR family transcriptional regulator